MKFVVSLLLSAIKQAAIQKMDEQNNYAKTINPLTSAVATIYHDDNVFAQLWLNANSEQLRLEKENE